MSPSAAGREDWLAVVLGLLRADAPVTVMGAPEDWPRWAVLLPHVLAATSHFEPLAGPREQPGRPETSWLLVHARLGDALPLAERPWPSPRPPTAPTTPPCVFAAKSPAL